MAGDTLISELETASFPSQFPHRYKNTDHKVLLRSKNDIVTYFEYPKEEIQPRVPNTSLNLRTRPAKSLKLRCRGRSKVEERM